MGAYEKSSMLQKISRWNHIDENSMHSVHYVYTDYHSYSPLIYMALMLLMCKGRIPII